MLKSRGCCQAPVCSLEDDAMADTIALKSLFFSSLHIAIVFGKIWSDQNNAELIQLPAGALYLVRPGSIKGSRECMCAAIGRAYLKDTAFAY